MGYNPYVDDNGNCVTCGTGQLNFDGKSTGCACSRVADAEYETEQRIIKLLEDRIISMSAYYSRLDEQEGLIRAIALIKGEGKRQKDNETVVLLTEEAETQRVALAWERERFDRLWQLEMDICKCEEAMQHLKVRMERTEGGIDYDLEFGENK